MTLPPSPNPGRNRRRSQRVVLRLAITVSGSTSDVSFREETQTMVVNAHGALIMLAAKVSQHQILRLKSPSHLEEQTCRVIYVGPITEGRNQVGIEFTKPAPLFWHIAFPPEDWMPSTEPLQVVTKSKS
jgi:hypothetical protein